MKGFDELEMRKRICQAGWRLHQRNLLASCDGNISFRSNDERILITPTGVSKGFLEPESICVINLAGQVLEGKPSGEMQMHLQIYRSCEKAKAVVHAHPPHAIAWTVAAPELKELPANSLSEVILATGSIPIAEYARPGTKDMGEVLQKFLPRHRAIILARHGALAWGEDLNEAVNGMERIDHSAQILYMAKLMGGLSELPQEEIQALKKIREQMGDRLF